MKKRIKKIFSEVADTYECVNHVLTFGLDIIWRKKAAREGIKSGGTYWLDVCSGTGEMARNLSLQAGENVKIVSVDFCYPMIAKALSKKNISKFYCNIAEASFLPFLNDTFDLVIISFATRNINTEKKVLDSHLKEFCRVLKPGGRFINLETSQPSVKIIQKLFHLYIKLSVKPIGFLLSRSKIGYSYLSHTIPRFYSPEKFTSILHHAGFNLVSFRPLFFGVAAIHTAIKYRTK